MANNIRVDHEVLRGRAGEYCSISSTIQSEVNDKLNNLKEVMESEWEGAASASFAAQYEELRSSFENIRQVIEDIATQVDKTADIYQETDEQLSSSFGVQ